MLSIIIPSAKDPHLQNTVNDLRAKTEGEIEIVVVLDGDNREVRNADKVLINPKRIGMRGSINRGVAESSGEYIMKIDSHCMFGQGYDKKLLIDIQDNWVIIPRRYKLDVDKWAVMEEEGYIDYDRLYINLPDKITGIYWTQRKIDRADVLIDDTMVMQGSCWVMSRKHWNWLGPLQEEGYGTFTQEPIEICLKTWLGGGRVVVNKHTWYAHKHRKFRRTVRIDSEEVARGNKYSQDFWLNNRWERRIHDLKWLFDRFGLRYNPYQKIS